MPNQITELFDTVFFQSTNILLNLLGATVLGASIAWVYRRTHHGLSYSRGFVLSLVLIAVVAAGAIMVVGSNVARAFGLVGALSIIRYRTAVRDTRDAAFIFLALVAGFACGTSSFLVGALTTTVVLAIAAAAHYFKIGALREHDFILTFALMESREEATRGAHSAVIDRYCQRHELLHVESGDSEMLYLTFDVSLKEGVESPDLVRALAELPNVGSPKLIFAKGDPSV